LNGGDFFLLDYFVNLKGSIAKQPKASRFLRDGFFIPCLFNPSVERRGFFLLDYFVNLKGSIAKQPKASRFLRDGFFIPCLSNASVDRLDFYWITS
jgi:hypothetical protein